MSWATETPEGLRITVKVTPRASRDAVCGTEEEWLKIRLQAPPVDGKANAALAAFLSKALGVPKRDVEILRGDTARLKTILVRNITFAAAKTALAV